MPHFDIKTAAAEIRINPDLLVELRSIDDYHSHVKSQVIQAFAKFTAGSQVRVSTKTKVIFVPMGDVPATNLDWLKSIVIKFEPTLRFGWLTPKYKADKSVHVPIEEHYWNVKPSGAVPEGIRQVYMENFGESMQAIDDFDWLTGEPPTMEDLRRKREEVSASGQKLAYWMP